MLLMAGDIGRLTTASSVASSTTYVPIYLSGKLQKITVGNLIAGTGSYTAGSVLFAGASGQIAQDNSNFFWDDTNDRLGIKTTAPTSSIGIGAGATRTIQVEVAAAATAGSGLTVRAGQGNGTDKAGGALVLQGGISTGNAAGGAIRFLTSPNTGSTGTTPAAETERARFFANGQLSIGSTATSTNIVNVYESVANSGTTADGYAATINQVPVVTGSGSITRLNMFNVTQVSATGATVTDGCLFRFNAAAGTHFCVDAATTKTTPGGVDAWVKINVNGTVMYMPAYTSKTA